MASAGVRLALAEMRAIYHVADVDKAMEHGSGGRNESLAALYERMKFRGGGRYLIKPTEADALDDLFDSCPNFEPVINDLRRFAALAIAGNEPMQFTPILLLGEPGVGKTHFAKAMANALGTGFEFVAMNSLTAGWVLSGASSQWQNAKPGKVAQTLIDGEYANPVVVLDEVDKAGGDSRYDPMGALYGLLERDTARHFKDEFVDVDIDASHILWVSTANDERAIPEPILNRMNVFQIPRPDRDAARKIAARLYAEIVGEHDWGFPAEIPEDVLDCVSSMPPRDMRKVLLTALGTAKLDGRNLLRAGDLDAGRSERKRKIGF